MSNLDYEGVVILGFPRSGTTLLRRLIDAHPKFCSPPETHLLRSCSSFLHEDYSAGGLTVSAVAGLAFSGIEEHVVIDQLRDMAFGFFRDIAARSGKEVWVEKTAFDIFHLSSIERLCGNSCRFICTTRNPLDVVCSVKEMTDQLEVYMPELHAYVRRYPNQLEAFAHAWVDVHSALIQFMERNPEICIRVSYENILEDSNAELDRIFNFLGAPADMDSYTERALSSGKSIGYGDWKTYARNEVSKSSTNRWKSLSDESLARLVDILYPIADQMGYEKFEKKKQLSAEKSRHKFELGRLISQMKNE